MSSLIKEGICGLLAEPTAMIYKAFALAVHPDCHAEYARRHAPIWPEMEAVLKAHGVHHYMIFLHPGTSQLFAYAEMESEERWEEIAQTEVCRRWWASMRELMPSNPDNSPQSVPLLPVFSLQEVPASGAA